MGVVSNGDNPTGPRIGVYRGTSSSSTGTKASRQAYMTHSQLLKGPKCGPKSQRKKKESGHAP